MRITTGIAKGRQVPLPKGVELRPTSDRVKQAMFNILGPGGLEGWWALDLFCGSGNLGLEALSRGALGAAFCDRERRCVEQARSLCQDYGLDKEGRSLFMNLDAQASLARLAREGRKFNIVFFDPPYQSEVGPRLLKGTDWSELLLPQAWLILEHDSKAQPEVHPSLRLHRACRYGSTSLSLYHPAADSKEPA
jgi:16S rRNA (guanine(966)-N(2))-methyltransferase RsmD